MKIPSLKLESKVLLTAAVICIIGILRMTHLIPFSDEGDISLLFLIGMVVAGLLRSSPSYRSAGFALLFLCWGLGIWHPTVPSKTATDQFFKAGTPIVYGAGFLVFTYSAIREYLKRKRNDGSEISTGS